MDIFDPLKITRRELLDKSGRAICLLSLGGLAGFACKEQALFSLSGDEKFIRPAKHWKKIDKNTVRCQLCPNECTLGNKERGACRVRENRDGALYTLVFSRLAAMHVDPIEKKPFFHLLPGSRAFSVATAGCNLSCKFCQNWELSQSRPEDLDATYISPADFAEKARRMSSQVAAFTYNEPTVQYEYILEAADSAKRKGIRTVIISNGYIKPEAGRELVSHLDGIKIDLKAFTQKYYRDICGGNLSDVLKNLEIVKASGKWLEIVVLIIPSLNDSASEITEMSRWIRTNLTGDVPVHFTRFHSTYLMKNLPPTPVATLERCREIARSQGIRYAYVGNVPGHRWENTYCHKCNTEIIRRSGFAYIENSIKNGRCPACGTRIPGVWG